MPSSAHLGFTYHRHHYHYDGGDDHGGVGDDVGGDDNDGDDDSGDEDGKDVSCLDWKTSAASPSFINNSCIKCNSTAFMIWMMNVMHIKMNVMTMTMLEYF